MMTEPRKPSLLKALLILGCYAISPFFLLALLVFGTTYYDDFRLQRFENNFDALAHPVGTKFLTRFGDVGTFGNGHHTDFLVAEIRSFERGRSQVQKFYKGKRVGVPNSDDGTGSVRNGAQEVEIELLPSPLPPKYQWKCGYSDELDLSKFAGRKDLYAVVVVNSSCFPAWNTAFNLNTH